MNFYKGELKNFDLCKIQKYIGENISLAICKNDKSIKLENNKEDLLNLLKEVKTPRAYLWEMLILIDMMI